MAMASADQAPTGHWYDAYFMLRALVAASHGQYTTHPNPNVGCVLVDTRRLAAALAADAALTEAVQAQFRLALARLAEQLPARLGAEFTPLPGAATLVCEACLQVWQNQPERAVTEVSLADVQAVCEALETAVVGTGWHARAGGPHAEVYALREAGAAAAGATVYVTLEPCAHHGRTPPCADALVEAQVARAVVAITDPFPAVDGGGLARLQTAGVRVHTGVLGAAAEALNPGFLTRIRTGRPYVRLKLAASLDGRTALANGVSQWITGSAARSDVQAGRARAGAILSGAGTVLADNPRLNVRPAQLPEAAQQGRANAERAPASRQPVRVIIDHRGEVTPDYQLCQDEVPVYLVRTRPLGQHLPPWVSEWVLPAATPKSSGDEQVDLVALLARLGTEGIHELWVEAGARLGGALLEAGVVDQLILYQAPKLLGDHGRPLVCLPDLTHMQQVPVWQLLYERRVGQDRRLTLTPADDEGS